MQCFSISLGILLIGKEKGKRGAEPVVAPPPEPEILTEEGEPPEPPPKTYVLKDRFDYFKPNIQVCQLLRLLLIDVKIISRSYQDHIFQRLKWTIQISRTP